jgi:hypothetical protein
MAHLESFRANTVDSRATYVAISRARGHASVYTDNRAKLIDALGLRDGSQVGAIDEDMSDTGRPNAPSITRNSKLRLTVFI